MYGRPDTCAYTLAHACPKYTQESLAALLGVPLAIATALVRRHPALACAPPNATITRVKSASMALSISMQVRARCLPSACVSACARACAPKGLCYVTCASIQEPCSRALQAEELLQTACARYGIEYVASACVRAHLCEQLHGMR